MICGTSKNVTKSGPLDPGFITNIYISKDTRNLGTTSENGIFYPSKVMLDLAKLKKVYPTPKGDYVVLEDLNLQIMKEEFVTIIGHSGCGKTTMLSMIAVLNPISGGNIAVLGNPVKGPGPDRGVIFQSPSLMPWMTALQNVLLGVNQVFSHATKTQRRDIAKYFGC